MRLNGISRRFAVMTGVAITVMVIGGSSCDGTYVPPPAGTVATGVTPYCANRPVPAGCPGYALNPVATPAVNCASFPIPVGCSGGAPVSPPPPPPRPVNCAAFPIPAGCPGGASIPGSAI